jgi:hypothetical protein
LSCPQLVFYEIYSPAKGAEEEEEEDAWDWAKQPPLNSKSILVLLTWEGMVPPLPPGFQKNHDSQFLGFFTKLKKHKYHSRQHEIDSFYATHHGFRFCSTGGTQTWKLFQETSIPFLKSLCSLLIHVEKLLLAFCPSK